MRICQYGSVFIRKNVKYLENVEVLLKRMTYFNVCIESRLQNDLLLLFFFFKEKVLEMTSTLLKQSIKFIFRTSQTMECDIHTKLSLPLPSLEKSYFIIFSVRILQYILYFVPYYSFLVFFPVYLCIICSIFFY